MTSRKLIGFDWAMKRLLRSKTNFEILEGFLSELTREDILYNDILYIIDSEKDAGRGYTDLTMMIRPDMRRFKILDILVEFKYTGLKEAGLSREKAKQLFIEDLRAIPAMQTKMKEAKKQTEKYGDALEKNTII